MWYGAGATGFIFMHIIVLFNNYKICIIPSKLNLPYVVFNQYQCTALMVFTNAAKRSKTFKAGMP